MLNMLIDFFSTTKKNFLKFLKKNHILIQIID